MKKLFVLVFTLISITTQAQNISGLVLAAKDKSPVQFASVGLLQLPDSSILTGVITLSDGGYSFDKIKPGQYFVKVSFMGYAPNGKKVEIKPENGNVQIDTIFLEETSQAIGEVTVTGERLKGQELVDRTVYSVPPLVAKSSANGFEILKKIPQVQVDFQNNITMNGTTNFIIQVDGKQRDKEFLAKLAPEDIQTIEIINNPSGKYEGNIDGVINIILKKEARFGLSGSIGAFIKPFNKPTIAGTGTLDYGMGKISFYVTAYSFIQSLNMGSTVLNNYYTDNSTNALDGKGDFKTSSTSVNTGFDYYINDHNNISFNINYKPTKQVNEMDNLSITNQNNLIVSALTNVSNSRTMSDEGSTSLFYKKTFKKAVQEFTAETNFYLFHSKNRDKYKEDVYPIYYLDPLNTVNRIEIGNSNRQYFSVKLNYVHPIGMAFKLETGYQLYYQQMDYDFTSSFEAMNNKFQYVEFRHSIYGGITANLKKWGIQSNVRIENSNNDINSELKSDYYCVLPSANVQYKFSASQNLKFTYNRRINRPGVYDLNPFEKIAANYNISSGNPYLEPEYRDKLQFTYTLNFDKNFISPYIYYERITDKISQRNQLVDSPYSNSLALFTQPDNLLTGNEKGLGINGMLWFLNINARYFKGHFDKYTSPTQVIPSNDYSSYSMNGYLFAQYPKNAKLTEFFFFSYNGVNINAQSKTYSIPFYGFGLQKQAGDHSFGFVYLLPFSGNIEFSKTVTQTPYLYSDSRTNIDIAYFIQFMYSYKFNKGKSVKKLNRKVEVESDSKNEGIGRQ